MLTLTAPTPLASLPTGAEVMAFLEGVFALRSRPQEELSGDARAVLAALRDVAKEFGAGVLAAQGREDLAARVDAVLEDERFQPEMARLTVATLPRLKDLSAQWPLSPASADKGLVRVLGAGAAPALRRLDRTIGELNQHIGVVRALISQVKPSDFAIRVPEPLSYLSDPSFPVPLARALLDIDRSQVTGIALLAATFSEQPLEPWLGVALVETWTEQLCGLLATLAALGCEFSDEVLPRDRRFTMAEALAAGESTQRLYVKFNADAERAGEPVYPAPAS